MIADGLRHDDKYMRNDGPKMCQKDKIIKTCPKLCSGYVQYYMNCASV